MELKMDRIWHGGDYNPEQWLEFPDILEEDIVLLKKAKCNIVTLGVFSWSMLEPQEGNWQFDWLGKIIDRLWAEGISVILATPSGARPKWLADRYPQVLRCNEDGTRRFYGTRHNHCYTSPVYREKTAAIDRALSKRFGAHPAVKLWHISNELGGECFCPLCQEAFRNWLRDRYQSIDVLNRRWSTVFWSHVYDSFDQIEAPSSNGENQLHALKLDWKRFVTHQTADFLRSEIRAVRTYSNLPVTTNLMYYYRGLDYFKLSKEIDVVSWDTYPTWHKHSDAETALDNGMCHDLMRSLKGKPFLQMESSPSATNWQGVSKLKKPHLLAAQALQAVAHGSDGAMYFQIRQSRGSAEKFHGAVIDHYGGADTRVMHEVAQTGELLAKLGEIVGTRAVSEAVILYDWDSIWAMEDSQGPRNEGLHYTELLLHFYRALTRCGIGVDLKDEESLMQPGVLAKVRLLIIPMGYMFRCGFDRAVEAFVRDGGILITTFWSGIVDENDRCYLGGIPHGLTQVLGVRSSEIDGLYDWEHNVLVGRETDGERNEYECRYLCDLPVTTGLDEAMTGAHLHGKPDILLKYGKDFYQGMPALTRNICGSGEAWYLASHAGEKLYEDMFLRIAQEHRLGLVGRETGALLPNGLQVTQRAGNGWCYRFYQNFSEESVEVTLPGNEWEVIATEQWGEGVMEDAHSRIIPQYGFLICRKASGEA